MAVRAGEPLAKHTTFRIGGPADAYVQARTLDQFTAAVRAAWGLNLPTLVIGGGSNLLIRDGGFRGLVIEMRARTLTGLNSPSPSLRAQGQVVEVPILAEAGAPLAALARKTAALGVAGLEWAIDVPGTVGGAVVNNAGAHGGDMATAITAAPGASARWRAAGSRSRH
ncbi:MAG: FAD-binding protein [Dehalococcoidia bacterium]